jgi:hypothetical protein
MELTFDSEALCSYRINIYHHVCTDKNTLENSTVQLVEHECQNEQNSSQEWVSSRHSAHQQILQFLKNQGPLTICMGHVPETYRITH